MSPLSGTHIERRIAAALARQIEQTTAPPCPPLMAECIRYALIPGGWVRPRLCLQVATALGDAHPALADACAVALELLHSASLAHDDLPCFDDADVRRDRPSLHRRFSEPLAVLTGDALIVMAFSALQVDDDPLMIVLATHELVRTAGVPHGLVAGQSWESEPSPDVVAYHRAKTGALFEAALALGALAGGGDMPAWRPVGQALGEAYQIADDLADVHGLELSGKTSGRDAERRRPNLALASGAAEARAYFAAVRARALEAVPPCAGRDEMRAMLAAVADRLLPPETTPTLARKDASP